MFCSRKSQGCMERYHVNGIMVQMKFGFFTSTFSWHYSSHKGRWWCFQGTITRTHLSQVMRPPIFPKPKQPSWITTLHPSLQHQPPFHAHPIINLFITSATPSSHKTPLVKASWNYQLTLGLLHRIKLVTINTIPINYFIWNHAHQQHTTTFFSSSRTKIANPKLITLLPLQTQLHSTDTPHCTIFFAPAIPQDTTNTPPRIYPTTAIINSITYRD